MDDHTALNRVTEMCQESCDPEQYEQWCKLVEQLKKVRGSLQDWLVIEP